jgi:type IV secretory pathway VirJ component
LTPFANMANVMINKWRLFFIIFGCHSTVIFCILSSVPTMRKLYVIPIAVFSLFTLGGYLCFGEEKTLQFRAFGEVHLYFNSPRPANVVLFTSGDGGWNTGVIDMAKALASLDSLVVGIDIVHYLQVLSRSSEKCLYPAGDLELLSKFVQNKLDYTSYVAPILVGYSSGATLVYTALVQAPSITFKGGISLGFCPDLQLAKPLCRGEGLQWKVASNGKKFVFLPSTTLQVPWIAMQGTIDQVCDPSITEEFVSGVKNGSIITLPKVGHGFSKQENWMPEFKKAFQEIATATAQTAQLPPSGDLKDLPLVEVPSPGSAGETLALLITGDGGWASPDAGIARKLVEAGIPLVGLNSLKYFWRARTPEETASDIERILAYYLSSWHKNKVILIGYSFGADVLPVTINLLPSEFRSRITLTVLISASHSASFKFELSDWIKSSSPKDSIPTLPEIKKMQGMKILCVYGEHDEDVLCKDIDPKWVQIFTFPGGHKVGNNFEPIADAILKQFRQQ